MKKYIYTAIIAGLLTGGIWFFNHQPASRQAQTFGAFGDPFLSIQVGATPSNGYYLKTDGTNSTWAPVAGGGGSGGGTWATTTSNVAGRNINYPLEDTDIVTVGSSSTTTAEFWFDPNIKQSFLTYASTTGFSSIYASSTRAFFGSLTLGSLSQGLLFTGSNSLVNSVATTTLTATSPLSLSQPVVKVGGSNSTLTIDTSGTWSGNAGTATALVANGANCSAGQAPLGVDASGAVESCFDVWTESENTTAGYVPGTRTLTVAGTANQITSSAGAQDLTANRTWTLSFPNQVIFPQYASSTLGFSTIYASSTNYFGANLSACDPTTGKLTWSAGVFGCGTDFNTGGAGGGTSAYEIATTSDIAVPNLAYFTKTAGLTTLGSVATGTLSGSNGITVTASRYAVGGAATVDCTVASGSAAGCLSSANWTTFNNKLGSYDAFTHPAVGQSATTSLMLLYGQASSTILSSNWLRVGGVASTTLTVDGLVYSAGTATSTFAGRLSVGTTTPDSLGSATFTVKSLMDKVVQFFTSAGVKVLEITDAGIADFTAAVALLIPNAANPTVDTTGEIAINTTTASSSIRFYDGSAERSLYDTQERSFFLSTSTLATFNGIVGTTTMEMRTAYRPQTLVAVSCKATTTGTAFLDFGDGTNWTNLVTCNTTGSYTTITTNNAFVMGEMIKFRLGTQASITQGYTISYVFRNDAD